jgi:hypothetical protein
MGKGNDALFLDSAQQFLYSFSDLNSVPALYDIRFRAGRSKRVSARLRAEALQRTGTQARLSAQEVI